MFEDDGRIDVRLTYDHRSLDGAAVARALAHPKEVLHDDLRAEWLAGPASDVARPADVGFGALHAA